MQNITTERLEQIEKERQKVSSDPNFQAWCQEMHIGRLWSNPEPLFNAREMNSNYSFSKLQLN